MTASKNQSSPLQGNAALPWLGSALLAHTLWGIYPVFARYLQTVSGLPSLAMLATAYLPLLIGFLVYGLPRDWRLIRGSHQLWVFALVVAVRSVTNVVAARYTLAIFVQMITLLTPFIVAAISRVVLHQKPPNGTLTAMTLSFIGSAMMLLGDTSAGLAHGITASDWIGIGFALLSALFLAIYMIAVGRTISLPISGGRLLLFQSAAIGTTSLLLSLATGEDWSRFATIGAVDWLVLAAFGLAILGGANGLQITSIRKIGAAVVSSIMGWRLLITLLAGMLLLQEGLTSPIQFAGMAITLAAVTWFLWKRP